MDAKVEAAATAGASQLAAAGAAGATAAARAGRFAGWNMHAKVRSGFCAVHAAVPTGRECVECRRSTEVGRWRDRVRPSTLVGLFPRTLGVFKLAKTVRPIERASVLQQTPLPQHTREWARFCPVVDQRAQQRTTFAYMVDGLQAHHSWTARGYAGHAQLDHRKLEVYPDSTTKFYRGVGAGAHWAYRKRGAWDGRN